MLDYHAKYHDNLDEEGGANSGLLAMQHRALCMERDALRWRLVGRIPIEDLAKARKATEQQYVLLSTFDAWKRALHFSKGGQFKDILAAHRDNIDACIVAAGGWEKAMSRIQRRANPEEDSSFWPEFFRVKVSEHSD